MDALLLQGRILRNDLHQVLVHHICNEGHEGGHHLGTLEDDTEENSHRGSPSSFSRFALDTATVETDVPVGELF